MIAAMRRNSNTSNGVILAGAKLRFKPRSARRKPRSRLEMLPIDIYEKIYNMVYNDSFKDVMKDLKKNLVVNHNEITACTRVYFKEKLTIYTGPLRFYLKTPPGRQLLVVIWPKYSWCDPSKANLCYRRRLCSCGNENLPCTSPICTGEGCRAEIP